MAEHENCTGESDEWFTPKKYFDAIGLVFDLDPAHPGIGTEHCTVPARKVYTIADDGLRQPWRGLVFCNPPYGPRYGHVPWLEKFISHGNGIGLFRAYTSANWFHEVLLPAKGVIMFPRGKIKFVRPDGSVGKEPGHGNVFIGLGETACRALLAVAPEIGVCWDRRSMTSKFVDAVRALIDAVLIEHCLSPDDDEAILNEVATANCTLAVLREIRAAPEFSSLHQWADKRLRADDYPDPDETLKIIAEFHQWVERQLGPDDDN